MFKIRDNVDLKDLLKFGFIIHHYSWGTVYERPLGYPEYSLRSIYIDMNTKEIDEDTERYNVIDVEEEYIKDLMHANLVEEVIE